MSSLLTPTGAGARFLSKKANDSLIIAVLGICQNCHVRNKEITTEVILFEYSRHAPGRWYSTAKIFDRFRKRRRISQKNIAQQGERSEANNFVVAYLYVCSLAAARTQVAADRNSAVGDPEGPPRALQTSECSELLNPTRTSCLILAQRQPGKLPSPTADDPPQPEICFPEERNNSIGTLLATTLPEIEKKNCLHFSICACHPCAGAMLIFSVSFQF